jgi:hypothetical protein
MIERTGDTAFNYEAFSKIRARIKERVAAWEAANPGLKEAQQALADASGRRYRVETPIVHNADLDAIGPGARPRLIIVADNPGVNEQKASERRYLIGLSGKLARGFFRSEGSFLGVDFPEGAIVLNKTPVHTPRTAMLRGLQPRFAALIEESQVAMADAACDFAALLGLPLWVIGYSELKPKGIFSAYAARLAERCRADARLAGSLMLYRHFSMNQFANDLRARMRRGLCAGEALAEAGLEHRMAVLGF